MSGGFKCSPIYVKIENTSAGDLNIHGANIRLASNNPNNVSTVNNNRAIIRTRYYNLSGVQVRELTGNMIYIQENIYDDGSVEREKMIKR